MKNITEKINDIKNWGANKPTSKNEWLEDIKKEQLHFKTDNEVKEMLHSLEKKIIIIDKAIYINQKYPDAKKKEIEEHISERVKPDEINNIVQKEYDDYTKYLIFRKEKISQSIERLKKKLEYSVDISD